LGFTRVQSEQLVSLTDPRVYGTADIVMWDTCGLGVFDFKFGNVYVDATENYQIGFYILGVLNQKKKKPADFEEIWGGIIQPPCENVARTLYTPEFLTALQKAIDIAVSDYDSETMRFMLGGHCGYCPRLQYCPRANGAIAKAIEEERHEAPEADMVLTARVAEQWSQAVLDTAVGIMQNGGAIEGYGLAKARHGRVWAPGSESLVRAAIGEENLVLPSPPALEKADKEMYEEVKEHVLITTHQQKSITEVNTREQKDAETIRLLATMR
jgi:hypothetical protein